MVPRFNLQCFFPLASKAKDFKMLAEYPDMRERAESEADVGEQEAEGVQTCHGGGCLS